jgi:hypothetical protein
MSSMTSYFCYSEFRNLVNGVTLRDAASDWRELRFTNSRSVLLIDKKTAPFWKCD